MRDKRTSKDVCGEASVRREKKKTDCPFSIQLVRSDQGVQKCRRAVKNLFTTSALFVNLIHSVIDFEGE